MGNCLLSLLRGSADKTSSLVLKRVLTVVDGAGGEALSDVHGFLAVVRAEELRVLFFAVIMFFCLTLKKYYFNISNPKFLRLISCYFVPPDLPLE